MKAKELREMTVEEVQQRLDETQKEYFHLRVQKSSGHLENPARIRQVRRDVARLLTVLHERDGGAQ